MLRESHAQKTRAAEAHETVFRHLRADDGIRTRDPHLGKVMRYQLRYVRVATWYAPRGSAGDSGVRSEL